MNNHSVIITELRAAASEKKTSSGEDYLSLAINDMVNLAGLHNVEVRDIEILALENCIVPERYQRSMGTLGFEGQLKLLSSSVAVVGLGGLGGLASQLLVRMGVGKIILIDGDVYSDSNLNRQVFSSELNTGEGKASFTASVLQEINGAVKVIFHHLFAQGDNLYDLLDDADVAMDCLDNIESRFVLQEACEERKILMVHGAVAGHMGQLAVIRPGENLLMSIYGDRYHHLSKGEGSDSEDILPVEARLGNPATTPAVVAAWQVSEAVKILTAPETALKQELLFIDLSQNETSRIKLQTF